MVLELVPLNATFKMDMQEAFQYGYEKVYRKSNELILPEKDIDDLLNTNGAEAYQAIADNNETHHNYFNFLLLRLVVKELVLGSSD